MHFIKDKKSKSHQENARVTYYDEMKHKDNEIIDLLLPNLFFI